MDEGNDPSEYRDILESGFTVIDDFRNDVPESSEHTPLSDSVKKDRNPYAVSQAFQVNLPGVNY